jgi:hypothetical protein
MLYIPNAANQRCDTAPSWTTQVELKLLSGNSSSNSSSSSTSSGDEHHATSGTAANTTATATTTTAAASTTAADTNNSILYNDSSTATSDATQPLLPVALQLHRAPTANDRGGYTAQWGAIGSLTGPLSGPSDVAVSWQSTTDTTTDTTDTPPTVTVTTVRAAMAVYSRRATAACISLQRCVPYHTFNSEVQRFQLLMLLARDQHWASEVVVITLCHTDSYSRRQLLLR